MKPKVIRIRQLWRSIHEVTFKLKGPRYYRELFRPVDGLWQSGEAFPVGIYSSPLRPACPEIQAALTRFTF